MEKAIPIGVEFYKEMIAKDYYYVDKTMLIKDILDSGAVVSLFARPRRFGKTLALTMLQAFFEDDRDRSGEPEDNSRYFAGKRIAACGGKYMEKQGAFPVISLTLKSARQPNFEMAQGILVDGIISEFGRHLYVLQGEALTEAEKEKYRNLYEEKASAKDYATSLAFLSECLRKYHNQKVVILIDEYDVPLENAWFEGFYDPMVRFVRSLFESALKTNESLELAVITGCLRVSRESIFTGLNNLEVITVLNDNYAEHFGFTQAEAEEMLEFYRAGEKKQELQEWYNGYLFGQTEVYNPWSVINYVKSAAINPRAFPKPYWANTSSNSIVRELVEGADFHTRKEMEELIAGGAIEKPVHEDITYGDIHESMDSLWNFLFFTGYLKKTGERKEEETIYLQMAIPNAEIRYIYRNTILAWFDRKLRASNLSPLLQAIEAGDCGAMSDFLSAQLMETISFFDYAENYYHGFLAGLLKGLGRYEIVSNRESGRGRPDILMKYGSRRGQAFIMEIKLAGEYGQMEAACREALRQAEEGNYRAQAEQDGYSRITVYGICFYKKDCLVQKA